MTRMLLSLKLLFYTPSSYSGNSLRIILTITHADVEIDFLSAGAQKKKVYLIGSFTFSLLYCCN